LSPQKHSGTWHEKEESLPTGTKAAETGFFEKKNYSNGFSLSPHTLSPNLFSKNVPHTRGNEALFSVVL